MVSHPNRSKRAPKHGAIPKPSEVRAARLHFGLTQAEAAALVYASARSWEKWESDAPSERRHMNPAVFELFILKASGKVPK